MWAAFVLSVFAVYRIAMLVTNEEGPFSLAESFRRGVRRRTQGKPSEWIARGVECPRCVSFWLSGLAAFLLVDRGYVPAGDIFLAWFGVAGVVFLMLVLIPFEVKIIVPEAQEAEERPTPAEYAESFFAEQYAQRYKTAKVTVAPRRPVQDGDSWQHKH